MAADLARRLGLPLVVASVLQPGPFPSGGPAIGTSPVLVAPAPELAYQHPVTPEAEQLDAARDETRRRVEQLLAQSSVGDEAQVEVALDASVPDGLRRIAAERHAELLVVGSRGRGAVKAALLGSTSHALVADAPCPVVVVPGAGSARMRASDHRPVAARSQRARRTRGPTAATQFPVCRCAD